MPPRRCASPIGLFHGCHRMVLVSVEPVDLCPTPIMQLTSICRIHLAMACFTAALHMLHMRICTIEPKRLAFPPDQQCMPPQISDGYDRSNEQRARKYIISSHLGFHGCACLQKGGVLCQCDPSGPLGLFVSTPLLYTQTHVRWC